MLSVRAPSAISSTLLFFFNDTSTPETYTLSLHDALPILVAVHRPRQVGAVGVPVQQIERRRPPAHQVVVHHVRSEEHTSELQSLRHLVCRLLLEKKNVSSEG